MLGFTTLPPADDERGRLAICQTIGCLSHVRTCHFGGPRRWPACATRLAAAFGGGGGLRLHRLPTPWLAFDFTTLPPADDERGRLAICQTIGCLSHVRTCYLGGLRCWPASALCLASALGGGGELRLHRLPAPRVVFGFTTLPPADDERGRHAIFPTIGWLSHVRTCHFSIREAGRYVLDVWQRLSVVVSHAFSDCPHCDWPSTARLFLRPMTSTDALQSVRR
jgi:hypothetical protein